MARTLSLDSPRIRFNWGFHDGAANHAGRSYTDAAEFARKHFDREYARGYLAGFEAAQRGESTESSEPAWKARRAA